MIGQRDKRRVAPYAPVRNVLEVLQRLRDRGLQVPVTVESLQVLGVPEGNAPRTLQALRFLGIVAEDGGLEPAAEGLHRATTEEYPHLLEAIIRKAYAAVWEVADPATSTEVQIADAFRQYDPAAQRPRMVTLFLGLCAEAGLVSPKPARSPRTEQKREAARTPRRKAQVLDPSRPRPGSIYDQFRVQTPAPVESSTPITWINEEDLALLEPDARKRLWDAIGELFLARTEARIARRAKASADPFGGFAGLFQQGTETSGEGEE